MSDSYSEPSENPFKKKAPAAAAPAADSSTAEGAGTASVAAPSVALARSVSAKAPAVPSLSDDASGSSTISAASAAAVPIPETRPAFAGPDGADSDNAALPGELSDAKEWGGGRPGGPPPKLPKRGCIGATRQCCGRAHAALAGSTVCSLSLLGIAAAGSFALFVYSLTQLGSRTVVGSQCPGTLGCAVGLASANCLNIGGGGQSCENVCAWYGEQGAAPVQFTVAGFKGASGSDAYVYCPFPKVNTNWRIPLTLFSSILSLVALLAVAKRWKSSVIVSSFLHFAAGSLYFWVMIQDSAAVDKASLACSRRFASLPAAGAYGTAELQCAQAKYVAVCLVDAALSLFTVSAEVLVRGRWSQVHIAALHPRPPRAASRHCCTFFATPSLSLFLTLSHCPFSLPCCSCTWARCC